MSWLKRRHHQFSARQRWLMVVIMVVMGMGVSYATNAQAALAADVVGSAIFLILGDIVYGLITLLAQLTGVFITIMVAVARYNTFLNAPVVQSGWPIVRDLMNMMFILALLIIAAGTVLRLQNYRYNQLLGKLIIMAFLVNFSKFIAVFLLQFAQVVMLTFVNAFRDAAFGNFSHMFGLDAVLNFANTHVQQTSTTDSMSIFITLVAGLAMMLIAFVVMLAITVVLFVRIIALWLLIILSPIAYAMRILPNTESRASQWWAEFTKYAVVGPVLAFFLWISLALVGGTACPTGQGDCQTNPISQTNDSGASTALSQANTDTTTLRKDFVSEILSINRLITFIVGIIFLMMGLQYAQKSGGAGAAFAGKVAKAGFGAASTVTGLNYLRDRTVAPVQGWLKNRSAARTSAIQERTQRFEGAGDRIAGTFGLTQRARERGAAASNAYERQKASRVAQRQGYKDKDEAFLLDRMKTTGDRTERIAAMQELQNRGRFNLGEDSHLKAFNAITNYEHSATGMPLMPRAEAQAFREKAIAQAAETANWTQAQAMLPSLSPIERAKLLQGMNSANHLDLDDDAQHAAFEAATNPALGMAGMKETDRRKFRQDALKSNADNLSEADLRRMVATMTTGGGPVNADELNILYQALEKKDALNAERPADVDIAERVRNSLRGSPQKLRQFEDDMKKNNANMAKQVIYHGFDGLQAGQQVLSDIQAGLFSASNLTKRDLASLRGNLESSDGFTPEQARNYLHNGILNGARSKEEYDRIMNSMNHDARHAATYKMGRDERTGVIGLDQTISREKRNWVAAQGAHVEAYQGLENGLHQDIGNQLTRQFVDDNAGIVLKNMREGKITRGTVRNDAAFAAAAAHNKIGRSGFDTLLSENPEYRNDVFETGINYSVGLDNRGEAIADNTDPRGLAQNAARDITFAAGRGRDTVDPRTGANTSSADVLYTLRDVTQNDRAQEQRQSFFARQGGTLIQMNIDPRTMTIESQRDAVISISPEALDKISDRNMALAQTIASKKRTALASATDAKGEFKPGVNLHGKAIDKAEWSRLQNQVKTISRSLRGY